MKYAAGSYRASKPAREVLSCLETAVAMDYVPDIDAELRRKVDHVFGTLVNLVKPLVK